MAVVGVPKIFGTVMEQAVLDGIGKFLKVLVARDGIGLPLYTDSIKLIDFPFA